MKLSCSAHSGVSIVHVQEDKSERRTCFLLTILTWHAESLCTLWLRPQYFCRFCYFAVCGIQISAGSFLPVLRFILNFLVFLCILSIFLALFEPSHSVSFFQHKLRSNFDLNKNRNPVYMENDKGSSKYYYKILLN